MKDENGGQIQIIIFELVLAGRTTKLDRPSLVPVGEQSNGQTAIDQLSVVRPNLIDQIRIKK